MDSARFDALTRSLAAVGSRRRAVAVALGGALSLRGLLDREEAEAHNPLKKCKRKSGKQKRACIKKAKKHNASHTADGGAGRGSSGGTGGTGGGGDDGGGDGDPPVCQPGASESCYSGPSGAIGVGECRAGTRVCQGDGTWAPCEGEVLPAAEICDGLDNDCDGITDEGFDVQTDVNNCGECGRTCTFPNATARCVGGTCAIETCQAGFADCNGILADGCETQLGTESNCSDCGDVCGGAGQCQMWTCIPVCGDGYCDTRAGETCENCAADCHCEP